MILVVEKKIDLANYLDVALVRQKHPTPNVFHFTWPKYEVDLGNEPLSKKMQARKLYITGHGSGKTIDGIEPNDLAMMAMNLIVKCEIKKIILLSCSSGKQVDFGVDTGVSTYCKVFSDKLTLDTKQTFAVTGFNGTQVTPPGGHSRVVKDDEETVLLRRNLIQAAFKGTESKKENLKKWCLNQLPTSSVDLIKNADYVYETYMGLVQDPGSTWPGIESTLKTKTQSKVYINR